jgi:hypothetical protein
MLRWIADRRGILVPSLIADARDEQTDQGIEAETLRAAAAAPSLVPSEVGSAV